MKKLKIAAITLGLLYALICTILYFLQDQMLFEPHTLPEDYDFQTGREVEIEVEENIFLNAVWIQEAPSKGVILYLHGKRGSIRRCLRQIRGMQGAGYDIFMPDYRGFGKSDGRITSEQVLHQDAQKVYDFLKKHYREDQIIVLGYSLGAAMATPLAANNNPQRIILVSPFLSIIDLKNRWAPVFPDFLIKYPLKNSQWIPKIKAPVTVFHGTEDELIPFEAAEEIQDLNRELTTLIPLEGVSHRGALFSDQFRDNLKKIIFYE